MASLVVKALQQDGVRVLMSCVPKCIEKDEKSGRLTASWITPNQEKKSDQFDTVLVAAGKMCCYIHLIVSLFMPN